MSNPSVLLLDEEPILLQATALMLSKRGASVSAVASAEAAIAAAASHHFDVVILDVGRASSAFAIARAIKASGAEPGKLIVCSEVPIARHEAHAFSEILLKPFPFESLVAAVFEETRRAPMHSGIFVRPRLLAQPAWRSSSSRSRTTTRRRSNAMS
jgi:DNA-binding response OmpR family regulator